MFNKKRLECWHSQLMQLRQQYEELEKKYRKLEIELQDCRARELSDRKRIELLEQFAPNRDSYALIGIVNNNCDFWHDNRKKEDYELKAYLPTCGQELWVKKDYTVPPADTVADDVNQLFSLVKRHAQELEALRMSHEEQAEIIIDLRNELSKASKCKKK